MMESTGVGCYYRFRPDNPRISFMRLLFYHLLVILHTTGRMTPP